MNGGGVRVRTELSGEPLSVRDARRLVNRTLREWSLDHLEDSATLLVSEVVTNAVLHARTEVCIELERRATVLRVTVADGSPRRPERRRHGLSAGTGRGLGLLSTLASAWGSGPAEDPWVKDVWFELPLDPAELPDPGEGAVNAV
jgi:anti-sigma regulatory factor (Ser/Thr protein kinase)